MSYPGWVWASIEHGAGLTKAGVDTATAVIGSFVALVGAYVGWTQVRIARQSKMSGDEKVARELIHSARRDTIADRDALIAQKDRDLERKDRELERVKAEHEAECAELRAEVRDRTSECDALREYARRQETVLLTHVPWDFEAVNAAAQAGVSLRAVPPLRPPPKEVL